MKRENEPQRNDFSKKFQERKNGVRSGSLLKDKTEGKGPLHGSHENLPEKAPHLVNAWLLPS